MTAPEWRRFANAVPLATAAAHGLGPIHFPGSGALAARLRQLPESRTGLLTAIDSAGRIGRQLLTVLEWHGGSVSGADLEVETKGADPVALAEEIIRLIDANLVVRDGFDLRLTKAAADVMAPVGRSLTEPQATTTDALAAICKGLGIPAAGRKQDRIDAIVAHLSSPAGRTAIRGSLTAAALALLDRLAHLAGPAPIDAMVLGYENGDLYAAEPAKYGPQGPVTGRAGPLHELICRGIVGVDPWNGWMWIWREGWPLTERSICSDWKVAGRPATASVVEIPLQMPAIVAVMGRALQHWDASPPPVLKGGTLRLGKPALRATAKAVGSDEASLTIIGTTALSVALLLANVVSVSGRGRNRTVEQVWRADPDARRAWDAMPAAARWLCLVSAWTAPPSPDAQQLLANRHLLLWELANLPSGHGFVDAAAVAAWMQDRYLPVGVDDAVAESIRDLRALGMVTASSSSLALTAIGRLALRGPKSVLEADFGGAQGVIVQSDLTITCPPDLDPELRIRIAELAHLESEGGASVFRLDRRSITGAVQRGDTEEEILGFLTAVSTVPLASTVTQLVADAARDADRVSVLSTTTVVVTRHPADLALACKVQAAKLTAVADTVAISPLPAEKVRAALDRKKLAPRILDATSGLPAARRGADGAAHLLQLAAMHKAQAEHSGNPMRSELAATLTRQAEQLTDPSRRFAVKGPLALSPELLDS